ncbi:MAG: right-handed parallel beta-helix repeat-containing protein [Candidatus Buchananbacteria bacterium]
MKRKSIKISFLALACLGFILYAGVVSASAKTYYVDATGGNDTNNGTSPATAWKTIGKVNQYAFDWTKSTKLNAGDSVLFKRGQVWSETLMIEKISGTSESARITFGAYGDSSLPKPIITGSDPVLGWTIYDSSKHLWQASMVWVNPKDRWEWDDDFAEPQMIFVNGTRGTKKTSIGELTAQGDWYFANNVLYLYSANQPTDVQNSTRTRCIYGTWNANADYITLENLELKNATRHTLSIYPLNDYWVVRNLTIHHGGMYDPAGQDTYDGQGISIGGGNNHLITNSVIYESGGNNIQIVDSSNTIVEHNISYNPHHHGIDIKGGDNNPKNNIIRDNLVYQTTDFTEDINGIVAITYDNDVVGGGMLAQNLSNTIISHNVIYGIKDVGILLYGTTLSEIGIYNNTIFDCTVAIDLESTGGKVYVKNNIAIRPDYSSWHVILSVQNSTDKYIDYNNWYSASSAYIIQVDGYGNDFTNQASSWNTYINKKFKSNQNFDQHSIISDPKLINISTRNFHLAANSLAIDRGTNLGLTQDFDGDQIPLGLAPDLGADEYVLVLSVCGNGIIEAGEQCDGSNLNGQTCQNNGYDAGVLSCNSSCQLVVLACTVSPKTYYLDASLGSDSNNGLSEATAWKTLAKLTTRHFAAGDTILLKRGQTWTEPLTFSDSGSLTLPITIGAYGIGSQPIIDGLGSQSFLLGINNADYITVKDLAFYRGLYSVVLNNTDNVILDNLKVYDGKGLAGIILIADTAGRCENNTVKNSTVYGTVGTSATELGSGILLYDVYCKNNLILNNDVYDNAHEGIVIWRGSNNLVKSNIVYRNAQSGIRVGDVTASGNIIEKNTSYANAQAMDDRYGIDLIRVGNDNIVRYNKVYSQRDTYNDSAVPSDPSNNGTKYGSGGIRFDGGGWVGNDHMSSTGNKIYYNLISGEYTGIDIFNYDNVSAHNNVIYNSGLIGLAIASYDATRPALNNQVKNNIIYFDNPANRYLIAMSETAGTILDHNLYFQNGAEQFLNNWATLNFSAWKNTLLQDYNSLVGNPLFVDPANFDFRIRPTSLAINGGADVGLSLDYNGLSVPLQTQPEIGAFEISRQGTIEFIEVPEYGSTVKDGVLFGKASGVYFDLYGVATYIRGADGNYYPKPNGGVINSIKTDGTWQHGIVTHPNDPYATEVISYLVPKEASLPSCWPQLCPQKPQIDQAISLVTVNREVGTVPAINYTVVPTYGNTSGDGILRGNVSGASPKSYGVATYIRGADTLYYPKPNSGVISSINLDGTWQQLVVTHPNDIYALQVFSFLVPLNTVLPSCWPDLCFTLPSIPGALASTTASF